MRRKRGHGQGATRDRGKSWLHEYRRQAKTLSKADYPTRRAAEEEFTKWRQDLDAKATAGPVTTAGELLERLIALQRRDEREGAYHVEKLVRKHLIPAFGAMDARAIGVEDVERYIDARKLEKTPRGTFTRNATINNEVTYLNSALGLLRPEPRRLRIAKLDTKDGIRRGLVSEENYRRLLEALEDWQKPVFCFSYYTGVRRGQLLKLRRAWGERATATGVIEVPGLYKGQRITKNGEPHHIPLYMPSMREFLKWALETGNPECPYLFQRQGERIARDTFYGVFKRIRREAGLEHILFHDLRRTAVTNMIEAGIPPEEAMSVSGHLTLSMLKRYSIVDSIRAKANVLRAGERMAEWFREKRAADYGRITAEDPEAKPVNGPKPN